MEIETLDLILNSSEKIQWSPINDLVSSSNVDVFYIGKEKIRLYSNFTFLALERLVPLLEKCLKGDLVLDESITKDIGYMSNEDFMKSDDTLVYDKSFWVGRKHTFLSPNSSYSSELTGSSWLYNNKNSSIVFKITVDYPWIFRDPDKNENFIEYNVWMKHYYKVLLERIIPYEIAEMWLEQIQGLAHQVKKNEERLRCRGEDCEMCAQEKAEKK